MLILGLRVFYPRMASSVRDRWRVLVHRQEEQRFCVRIWCVQRVVLGIQRSIGKIALRRDEICRFESRSPQFFNGSLPDQEYVLTLAS